MWPSDRNIPQCHPSATAGPARRALNPQVGGFRPVEVSEVPAYQFDLSAPAIGFRPVVKPIHRNYQLDPLVAPKQWVGRSFDCRQPDWTPRCL